MRLGFLLLAVPLLAGFTDREFGKVNGNNIAVMAGPLPPYAGEPMEGTSGLLSARAVNRYRSGVVKPLTITRSSGLAATTTQDVAATPGGPVTPQ